MYNREVEVTFESKDPSRQPLWDAYIKSKELCGKFREAIYDASNAVERAMVTQDKDLIGRTQRCKDYLTAHLERAETLCKKNRIKFEVKEILLALIPDLKKRYDALDEELAQQTKDSSLL